MRHDPERAAATYLAGELDRRGRTRFERHLLGCEDCWWETKAVRTGRMLAESLRETAPAALRERIRAVATLPAAPRPRRTSPLWWPYTLVAAAVAVLVLIVVLVPDAPRPQPVALTEAANLYRTGAPQQHTYTAPSGARLLVITSPERFPRAVDAHEIAPARSWTAEVDGTVMLCVDQPGISWLAIAATDSDALTAGRVLGLVT